MTRRRYRLHLVRAHHGGVWLGPLVAAITLSGCMAPWQSADWQIPVAPPQAPAVLAPSQRQHPSTAKVIPHGKVGRAEEVAAEAMTANVQTRQALRAETSESLDHLLSAISDTSLLDGHPSPADGVTPSASAAAPVDTAQERLASRLADAAKTTTPWGLEMSEQRSSKVAEGLAFREAAPPTSTRNGAAADRAATVQGPAEKPAVDSLPSTRIHPTDAATHSSTASSDLRFRDNPTELTELTRQEQDETNSKRALRGATSRKETRMTGNTGWVAVDGNKTESPHPSGEVEVFPLAD